MTVRVTELKRKKIFFHWSTTYSQNRKQLLMHEQGVKCARSCIILFQDNSKQCSYNRDLFVYQMSEYLISIVLFVYASFQFADWLFQLRLFIKHDGLAKCIFYTSNWIIQVYDKPEILCVLDSGWLEYSFPLYSLY